MTHICLWCWSSQTFALTFSWFYAIYLWQSLCNTMDEKTCILPSLQDIWCTVDCRKQLCTTYIYSVTYYVKPRGGNEKRGRLVRVLTHHTLLHTTSDSSPSSRYVRMGWLELQTAFPIIVQLKAKIIKYDVFNVQCSIWNRNEELQVTTVANYCRLERHI